MGSQLNALFGATKLLLGNPGCILVIDEALEIILNDHHRLQDNANTNPVRQAYSPEDLTNLRGHVVTRKYTST